MDRETRIAAAIIDATQDVIYVVNRDYVLDFMNPAMIREFGDGVGKHCYRTIHHLDRICPWCHADSVFEGKTFRREIRFPTSEKTYDVIDLPLESPSGAVSMLSICRDITRRKQSEQRLKDSEEQYQNLFERVGCGVYVSSKEGKFENANQALIDMLGYRRKEEFLSIDIARDLYLQPEDRQKFQDLIEAEGRVTDYEVDFKRRDGSPARVLLTSHVRRNPDGDIIGYEGIIVDQSHRQAMEQELKEAYDFTNNIIHSSPNAIVAADMKGNIIIWNPAAEDTFGYNNRDVIGKMNIRKVYPEGIAHKIMKMLRSTECGGKGKLKAYPMVFVRKDGAVAEGNLYAAIVYDAKGNEIATVGSFVDLEERLTMERALRRTQSQLLQAEKLAAMGRLTSQIAHELNNPLYGIMNTLELLKTEIPPENRRRKILDMALSETVRLSELLRKMLSFSKPDQEEKQAVDINTLLDEILLLHEKQLRENDIQIVRSFAQGLPHLQASKNQLRQVFINLISNSVDAMPNGGTFTVATSFKNDFVDIAVSDTGIGIEKELQNKIFDSFFTTKGSVKGVGLGLSVCFGFIKEHGGDIQVKSKVGDGTTFTVSLPRDRRIIGGNTEQRRRAEDRN
jgi:two-component system NtrC family sensor kinase